MPVVDNYINGAFHPPSTGEYLDVINPADDSILAKVAVSNEADVNKVVDAASSALEKWSSMTIKARAAIMLKFHALMRENAQELAELIVAENGKNITEALADVAKGNETVEYACSLPQLAQGRSLQVSGQVFCEDRREPLGVIASIVPFNFPCMVPMWTLPIALVMGNTVILKPSEKVPMTMHKVASLIEKAGFPPGVFNMVQGTKVAVQSLIQNPVVKAVTFVGSSPVAKIVKEGCDKEHKRCTALGGAKNHLIALHDCEVDGAAKDICVSFAGCAGQRCMAASVLLLVDAPNDLLEKIIAKTKEIQPGQGPGQMGPVIDVASYAKIISYIEAAEKDGAEVLLDGRSWKKEKGNWVGPTILLHKSPNDKTIKDEVFGPVLSVYKCSSWEEAIAIENGNPFGNAASIYTTNGANADWFLERFRAGMLGVNIGIPVPREPFSFGGLYGTRSKFGDLDITAEGAMHFFSNCIKVTSKWPLQRKRRASQITNGGDDAANFAGSM
uniref:methylmalonate-semialdehyde dehydrogenase (CoA acylating) n=1 Tax=Amphora coffeiformis TaxID=265554 RepID=A0A7S3P999_9STRA|mmetsp:Transcript_5583/g.11430  ORF Transcript_5583/g.11430 Transcript_5583/m.11430 type:complete len:501 (-) Transcript_5583:43-1545(-)